MAPAEEDPIHRGLFDPSPDGVRKLLRNLHDLPALSSSALAHHPDVDRIIRQLRLTDMRETRGLALSMIVEDIIRNGISESEPDRSIPWTILLMRYIYRMPVKRVASELAISERSLARRESDGLILFGRALIASLMPTSTEEP